jgi:hypothetical protein
MDGEIPPTNITQVSLVKTTAYTTLQIDCWMSKNNHLILHLKGEGRVSGRIYVWSNDFANKGKGGLARLRDGNLTQIPQNTATRSETTQTTAADLRDEQD